MIEVKNITKIYKTGDVEFKALDNVSFSINDGEFVAIMGPSGSGKSTLMHMIGILDQPTSGVVRLEGDDVEKLPEKKLAELRNKHIGFVFQAFNLLPRTSVYENVLLPLVYSDFPESEWDARVTNAIRSVGLEARAHHEPSELSGGEKQRAAIARALVTDPTIIFADEPTGNLDSKSGKNIMSILQKLNIEQMDID